THEMAARDGRVDVRRIQEVKAGAFRREDDRRSPLVEFWKRYADRRIDVWARFAFEGGIEPQVAIADVEVPHIIELVPVHLAQPIGGQAHDVMLVIVSKGDRPGLDPRDPAAPVFLQPTVSVVTTQSIQ